MQSPGGAHRHAHSPHPLLASSGALCWVQGGGKKKGGALKGKHLSNRVKGDLQQMAAAAAAAGGEGGSNGNTPRRGTGSGAGPSRAGSNDAEGSEGQGRGDAAAADGAPSSAAVQEGLQDASMRRQREMRDGVMYVGRMQVSPGD